MNRVAIIANTGSGKSMVGRRLSLARQLPFFSIDQILLDPGWTPIAYIEGKRRHDQILAGDQWIIDGLGPSDLMEARFAAADTIIFVDLPLYVYYWWTIKRKITRLFRPRPDGPEDSSMLSATDPLFKLLWDVRRQSRPSLLETIEHYRAGRDVFHIQSLREFRRFVRTHCDVKEQ